MAVRTARTFRALLVNTIRPMSAERRVREPKSIAVPSGQTATSLQPTHDRFGHVRDSRTPTLVTMAMVASLGGSKGSRRREVRRHNTDECATKRTSVERARFLSGAGT